MDETIIWTAQSLNIINPSCELVGMSDVSENIIVEFCGKKRTTMGTAWTHYGPEHKYEKKHTLLPLSGKPRGGIIKFNANLFSRADEYNRKRNTVHELAHILANLLAGKSVGHSKHWKDMMLIIGKPYSINKAERCHKVDTSGLKRKQKRFLLECPERCGWSMKVTSSRRTRRMNSMKAGYRYRCPCCSVFLKVEHYVSATLIGG